ncbi:O-antigen ligase [Halanaerobium sp. DL-01]|uniref:O-antigen ligase family protein n=1 Tax=Halanaerobium sp. DL-01 TaxID=1653064 RepID=UPI000DF3B8B8|nr:O-antigen ligase family protein [Halanaerobium sp. DL-01]RCW83291.1 O-antigen ligase [Halanaerobium sp. DL-01]
MKINNFIIKFKDFCLTLYSISSALSLAMINFSLGIALIITTFEVIKEKKINIKNNKVLLSFFLFILAIIFSIIDSVNIENSLDYLNRFIYPLIAFSIIRFSNLPIKKIKKYSILILFSIFLNLVYGYYQYFNGIKRIHGFLFVMEFAGLLAFLIIVCFIYIWNPNIDKKFKYLLSILFIVSTIGLIMTGTRGVWLSLTGSIFIIVFLLNKQKLLKFSLLFIIIIIVLFIFLPDYYSNRFMSIFDLSQNRSNITRLNLWRGAILIFKDNIFNGIGINNFSQIINLKPYYKQPMVSTVHTHNNYLSIAAETGIVGLLSYIFLIYNVISKLLNQIKNSNFKLNKFYFYSTLGIYINYLLQGMTEYNLVDRYMNIIVWIFIAFSINMFEVQDNNLNERGD